MEDKLIVVGDYKDIKTGIRFVEDTRGNYHCCYGMMDMPAPAPSGDTINNYESTNNYDTTNNNDTTNNYQIDDVYKAIDPTVIFTTTSLTWASTTTYNRINTGSGYFTFTTPIDKEFHIVQILAAQYRAEGEKNGVSSLGLYRGGPLLINIPLLDNLYLSFFRPIKIPPATLTEIKYKPFDKKAILNITMIGYLVDVG